MPVTTSFTALGAGNGFPSCLITNTQALYTPSKSIGEVMNVFWGLSKINIENLGMTNNDVTGITHVFDISVSDIDLTTQTDPLDNQTLYPEPNQRVCAKTTFSGNKISSFTGSNGDSFSAGDPSSGPDYVAAEVSASLVIRPTTKEDIPAEDEYGLFQDVIELNWQYNSGYGLDQVQTIYTAYEPSAGYDAIHTIMIGDIQLWGATYAPSGNPKRPRITSFDFYTY